MSRTWLLLACSSLALAAPARGEDPLPVGFLKDVAPILARNCIACHNPKKSEGKYIMTTFAQLAKGGQQGEGITLEPGKPDESYFVELIRPDAAPRMPFKQEALPGDEIALIERWVAEGARYDGASPGEDWPGVLRKATPVTVPEVYPVAVPITGLAFSPDGSEILASGYHELTGWKTADGSPTRRVRGVDERVHDLAYSPDGKWLATAGGDPGQYGSVKLWAVAPDGALTPSRDLVESTDSAFAVAFSPDGSKLAAAGADRAVRIWEVATGVSLAVIEDHADWIFDIAFSPDGTRLATASRDKTSKVFDVAKKEALATFPSHNEAVYCVTLAPDGKSVVTGGGDAMVRVWNPDQDAKQSKAISGFNGPIFRLQFHPDGKRLFTCGSDKTVRIYEDYKLKTTFSDHVDWVYGLALSPDGKTLASGSWDGEIRLWDLEAGKSSLTILAAPGLVKKAAGDQAAK